jgi:hypothetical protein
MEKEKPVPPPVTLFFYFRQERENKIRKEFPGINSYT